MARFSKSTTEKALMIVQDERSSGTAGGSFSSGAWRTRTLNTVKTNDIDGASLSSNRITLPKGKYHVKAKCPSFFAGESKASFYNVTDGTIDIYSQNGGSIYTSGTTNAGNAQTFLEGTIEISDSKVFEVQHRSTLTRSSDGFGRATSFGVNEVYTNVTIEKIG